jgi:hypothetical protein
MRRTTIGTIIVANALSLALAGCTADSADAPDTGPFVACMRSHGLPDFPDVTVSAEGLVNFDIKGERADVRSEKYGPALRVCESLLPDSAHWPDAPPAPPAP